MNRDDAARGCGLAVLALFAVLALPGLYAVYKLAPCITGEVYTSTVVGAGGELLTTTTPVCPDEGQTYVRAVGLAMLVACVLVVAVLGTLAFNGLENVGLGMVAISRGQAPINATARDVTPDDRRAGELHVVELQYKQAMAELTAIRAQLGRQTVEDRKGWQAALPVDGGAPAANGNGNGSKPGADLAGFEVM